MQNMNEIYVKAKRNKYDKLLRHRLWNHMWKLCETSETTAKPICQMKNESRCEWDFVRALNNLLSSRCVGACIVAAAHLQIEFARNGRETVREHVDGEFCLSLPFDVYTRKAKSNAKHGAKPIVRPTCQTDCEINQIWQWSDTFRKASETNTKNRRGILPWSPFWGSFPM